MRFLTTPRLIISLCVLAAYKASGEETFIRPGKTRNTGILGYELIWSDEFDVDGAVSDENWFHQTQLPTPQGWFNDEEQHYTDRIDNSYVKDGFLHIVAKNETFADQGLSKGYTSARLNSKFAFRYGRVDVRAMFEGGHGTWPAIWMLGRNIKEPGSYWFDQFGTKAWPACGEIDIMEHFGWTNGVIHGSVHSPSSYGATTNTDTKDVPDFDDEFHIYSMIWDQRRIQFLVDNVPFYEYQPAIQDASTWPFDNDHFILLNFALGGAGGYIPGTFEQATMWIDYVRVYQREILPPDDNADNVDSNITTTPSAAISRAYTLKVAVMTASVFTAMLLV